MNLITFEPQLKHFGDVLSFNAKSQHDLQSLLKLESEISVLLSSNFDGN